MKSHAVAAAAILTLLLAVGCGGGGDDSSEGLSIEGTLIQGSDAGHAKLLTKHADGTPIGAVEICALGSCSTTDGTGHWGFLVEGDFAGGDVLFTVTGHGISASPVVTIPAGANDADVAFINNGGVVSADSVVIDGLEQNHSHESS